MHYIDAATRLKRKESCVLSNAKVNHSSQKTEVFAKKKLRFFIISIYSVKTSGLFHDTSRIFYVFSLLLKRRRLLSPLPLVNSSSCAQTGAPKRTHACASRTQRVCNSYLNTSRVKEKSAQPSPLTHYSSMNYLLMVKR